MPRRHRRGEVGLVDMCLLLLHLGAGVFVAAYAGKHYGVLGAVMGFPLGVAGTFAAVYLLVFSAGLVEGLFTGLPWLPPCAQCGCKAGLLVDMGDYEIALRGDEPSWRCRCGRVFQKQGRRFLEVLPDGTRRPHLVWRPFRGWRPDDGEGV